MGVNFAGVDLLLEDREGKVREWFNRWLHTEDARRFVDWNQPLKRSGLPGTTAACYTGETVPWIFYSRPQRIKVNTWYQPTGCSRWSYGFFLATKSMLTQIQQNLGTTTGGVANVNGLLTLTSSLAGGPAPSNRVFNAYMLPAQCISSSLTEPNGLWLIPLVDERWYWQFLTTSVGPQTPPSPPYPPPSTFNISTTWNQLFSLAANQSIFGALAADTVQSAYQSPNWFFLNGPASYAVFPVVMDLLFHSVGLRLVPSYPPPSSSTTFSGHNWKAISWGTSKGILGTNLQHQFDLGILQAGSALLPGASSIFPSFINVNFTAWMNGITVPDYSLLRYTKSLPVTGGNPNFQKNINSTALADFTFSNLGAGGGTPDNQARLDALAGQIAQDYFDSLFWTEDSVVIGISQWQESGYDDFIEFSPGYWNEEIGDYVTKTRIHTIPHNFGSETMFHFDFNNNPNGTYAPPFIYGQNVKGLLQGTLSAGGTQQITVNGGDSLMTPGGPGPSGTALLTVTSPPGGPSGTTGQTVFAERQGTKWIVVGAPGGSVVTDLTGSPTANTLHGNSATFNLTGGGTQTAFVRKGAVLTTGTYVLAYNGATYEVANPELLLQCQFNAVFAKSTTATVQTLYSGSAGTETSTGLTDSIYIRRGIVVTSKTYDVAYDETGWKVLNPEIVFRGQCTTTTVGYTTATFIVFIGTQGSEATGTTTVTAFIRNGVIFANKTYEIDDTDGGYEARLDTAPLVKNLTGADIAKGASGTVTLITPGGSTLGVTITATARYGIFKNNAIGRAMTDNVTNTLSWTIESTDTC